MESRLRKITTKYFPGMLPDDIKLMIIGYGAVAIPFLYMVLKWTNIRRENIIVIDKLEKKVPDKIRFVKLEVTINNYVQIVNEYNIRKGDTIVDLSYYVCTTSMLYMCADKGIHFINSSYERWKIENDETFVSVGEDMCLFEKLKEKINKKSATAAILFGQNPGIANLYLRICLDSLDTSNKSHAEKAYNLGLETIHVSEIDNQCELNIKENKNNEKYWRNTWSVEAFVVESSEKAEVAFGSHEKKVPEGSKIMSVKNVNMLTLNEIGFYTKIKSYVLDREIIGKLIQHGETYTIAKYLSIKKYNYYPTVNYAYCHCDAAEKSYELFQEDVSKQKILDHSNSSGYDICGLLFLFNSGCSWWTGSVLGSEETKFLFPDLKHCSPTTIQVVAGIISALYLCYKYPNESIKTPDDLNDEQYKYVMKIAEPLLGDIVNKKVNYNPKSRQLTDLLVKR